MNQQQALAFQQLRAPLRVMCGPALSALLEHNRAFFAKQHQSYWNDLQAGTAEY